MNGLLPIIRRARRQLYPPDGAGALPQLAPAAPPAVVEPLPVPVVEAPVESALAETAPLASVEQAPAAVVEAAPLEPVALVAPKRKRSKRVENPPA